jgi:hypothetical protein
MAEKEVSTIMSTDQKEENYELFPLGLRYRAELPHILKTSDSDLDAALAALDRYLSRLAQKPH